MWHFVLHELTNTITYRRLFILYSESYFSSTSYDSLYTMSVEYGAYSEIISYKMKDSNEEQALTVCSMILSQCSERNGLIKGCLIANVLERSYQQVFYKQYKLLITDTDTYPIVSFHLDENIMDNTDNGWVNVYILHIILYIV